MMASGNNSGNGDKCILWAVFQPVCGVTIWIIFLCKNVIDNEDFSRRCWNFAREKPHKSHVGKSPRAKKICIRGQFSKEWKKTCEWVTTWQQYAWQISNDDKMVMLLRISVLTIMFGFFSIHAIFFLLKRGHGHVWGQWKWRHFLHILCKWLSVIERCILSPASTSEYNFFQGWILYEGWKKILWIYCTYFF